MSSAQQLHVIVGCAIRKNAVRHAQRQKYLSRIAATITVPDELAQLINQLEAAERAEGIKHVSEGCPHEHAHRQTVFPS